MVEYGHEILKKILYLSLAEPPEVICKNVIADVLSYQNNILFDDVSILVFERKAFVSTSYKHFLIY